MGHNCKPQSLARRRFNGLPGPFGQGRHADSFIVSRVRPRTSKGITDLLSLSLVRLFSSAACPSKKSLSSWEPAVALVTYRDPPATAANAARFTAEPDNRRTCTAREVSPTDGTRRPATGTRMARPRPTTAVYGGRTRSGIPGRTDEYTGRSETGRHAHPPTTVYPPS